MCLTEKLLLPLIDNKIPQRYLKWCTGIYTQNVNNPNYDKIWVMFEVNSNSVSDIVWMNSHLKNFHTHYVYFIDNIEYSVYEYTILNKDIKKILTGGNRDLLSINIKKILDYWTNSLDIIEAITKNTFEEFEKIIPEVNYMYKPNKFDLIEQKSQRFNRESLA